ncbi:hypothetical protein D3C84_558050 [compost metagenome]
MAHDFSCTSSIDQTVYFFGYANGVVYDAFDARSFNAGSSGNGSSKKVTVEEIEAAIQFLNDDSRSTSPVIELAVKLADMLYNHEPSMTYKVCFS